MHGYVGIERGSGCILHASGLYDRYLHSQNIRIFMSCLIHFQGLVSSGLACQSDFPLRSRGNASNVQLELSNRQRPSLVSFWLGKQEAAYAAIVTRRKRYKVALQGVIIFVQNENIFVQYVSICHCHFIHVSYHQLSSPLTAFGF